MAVDPFADIFGPGGDDPTLRFAEQIVSGKANRRLQVDASRGLIPFEDKTFGQVMGALLEGRDREIVVNVFKTLKTMPKDLIKSFAKDRQVSGVLLDAIARVYPSDEELLYAVVTNRQVTDKGLCTLAKLAPKLIQDVIANNQERIRKNPAIVDALLENPSLHPDVRMRILIYQEEFAAQEQVRMETRRAQEPTPEPEVETEREVSKMNFEQARKEWETLTHTGEEASEEGLEADLPTGQTYDKMADWFDKMQGNAAPEEELGGEVDWEDVGSELSEMEEHGDASGTLDDPSIFNEEDEGTLGQKIAKMTVPEREMLARLGTSGARSLLIRDPAKSVAESVINSPKVTEEEIERFAKMKGISKDVLRSIGMHREWSKSYIVNLYLVKNPLTPMEIANAKIKMLRDYDLKDVAKSREIPGSTRESAKRMMELRAKRQGGAKKH